MAETTNSSYTIRYATESDVDTILSLIKDLAIYENALLSVEATSESLLATLSFPSNPTRGYAKTLLIFPPSPNGGTPSAAGMALYFNNYSTWTTAAGIYLEDLFVRDEFRGKGYGKALLQALARECVDKGFKRLDWSVLKWNKPSIDFYESDVVGATMMSEWVGMRVDGDGLGNLANAGPGAGAAGAGAAGRT